MYTIITHFWEYKDGGGESEVKKRSWVSAIVARSHMIIRNYMGSVDQTDAESQTMSLTPQRVQKYHHKQLFALIENTIMCVHGNFYLDPSTKPDSFKEFHNNLIKDLLNLSPDCRKYKILNIPKKWNAINELRESKRYKQSHKKKKKPSSTKEYRNRISSTYWHATDAVLNCHGLHVIGVYLRFYPNDGSCHGKKQVARRLRCKFCGKQGIKYKCV